VSIKIYVLNNNILIISPHLDDGALGCGGTIAKLIQSGSNIHYIVFSIGEAMSTCNYSEKELIDESTKATQLLGISNFILKKFPVRKLGLHRQEMLEILIHLKKSLNPQMVFMPSGRSIHQDHKAVFLEGIRAFKHTSCFGYDLPWDTDSFKTECFFVLNKNQLNLKIESLSRFKSASKKIYMDKDFIYGLSRVRGTQINVEFAEAFEVIRSVN
jgi:hypothetical protein